MEHEPVAILSGSYGGRSERERPAGARAAVVIALVGRLGSDEADGRGVVDSSILGHGTRPGAAAPQESSRALTVWLEDRSGAASWSR